MDWRIPPSKPAYPLWQKYLVFMPMYFAVLAIWYGAGVNSQDNVGNFALLGMVLFMFDINHHYQKKSDQEYSEALSEWEDYYNLKPPEPLSVRSYR
jgi:hypothetical protein